MTGVQPTQRVSAPLSPLFVGAAVLGWVGLMTAVVMTRWFGHVLVSPGQWTLLSAALLSGVSLFTLLVYRLTAGRLVASQHRGQEMRIRRQITARLKSGSNLSDILDVVLAGSRSVLLCDRCAIYLKEPGQNSFRLAASQGISSRYAEAVARFGTSLPGMDLWLSGRTVTIEDVLDPRYDWGDFQPLVREEGYRSAIVVPLWAKGQQTGILVLYYDQLTRFSAEDLALAEDFANQAGVAIESLRAYEAETRLRNRLQALLRAIRTLNGLLLDEHLPDRIVQEACRLVGAESGRLVCRCSGHGLDGCCRRPREMAGVPDRESASGVLKVPLAGGRGCLALLELRPGSQGFCPEDEHLLATFAEHAGAILENADLSRRLQDLRVTAERERISMDLHDGVLQSLYAVGMGLEALLLKRPSDHDLTQAVGEAVESLDAVVSEIRRCISNLRSPSADPYVELGQVLSRARLWREPQVAVSVDPEALQHLPPEHAPHVVQILQEALWNALRHARAREVRVRLQHTSSGVSLEVADDGCGFDPDTSRRGLGLTNMARRAKSIGGELRVESRPAGGTTVRLHVPLPSGLATERGSGVAYSHPGGR